MRPCIRESDKIYASTDTGISDEDDALSIAGQLPAYPFKQRLAGDAQQIAQEVNHLPGDVVAEVLE